MQDRVSYFKFISAAEDALTKGENALKNNDSINAKLYLQKAITYFGAIDDKTHRSLSRTAFAYYLLGRTSESTSDLELARDCYQQAITNMQSINRVTIIDEQMIRAYQWHLNDVKTRIDNIAYETRRPITKLKQL